MLDGVIYVLAFIGALTLLFAAIVAIALVRSGPARDGETMDPRDIG
jgi:hypothetical protein